MLPDVFWGKRTVMTRAKNITGEPLLMKKGGIPPQFPAILSNTELGKEQDTNTAPQGTGVPCIQEKVRN